MKNEKQIEPPRSVKIPWWVDDVLRDTTPNRVFWITKGLGAGGTYGGAIWHIAMCLINRRSQFSWAMAPTFQQVADTLVPTFTEVLQNVYGFSERSDFSIVKSSRPRIELKCSRQEIHLKSANQPERLVGATISHIMGSEPGLWDRSAFEKSGARRRAPNATRIQSLFEGTPEGLGNFYEQEANFPEGVHPTKNSRRIKLWTSDNPVLSASYVGDLGDLYSYDKAKLTSYLYGDFVSFDRGQAYAEFRESRNVKLDLSISPYVPIIFCWDFNAAPMSWVSMQRQPYEKNGLFFHRYAALQEGSGEARGLLDGCAEFVQKHPPDKYRDVPIEVDGGHDGYSGTVFGSSAYDEIVTYLKRYYSNVSITAAHQAPQIRDRVERVNVCCAYERFVVAAWCQNLIKSLTQSKLKEGQWSFEKKKGKDFTHFADAVGYPLYNRTRDEDFTGRKFNVWGTNKL